MTVFRGRDAAGCMFTPLFVYGRSTLPFWIMETTLYDKVAGAADYR
jgi:hypothetical protein